MQCVMKSLIRLLKADINQEVPTKTNNDGFGGLICIIRIKHRANALCFDFSLEILLF